MWDSSYLPSSFISQPTVASQKLHCSWRSRCLLSSLPFPLRRQETPGEMSLFARSTQHTHPNWGLHPYFVLSGSHPAYLSAGSHTQMHSRAKPQRMVCLHLFLPGLWTKNSFPRLGSAQLEKDFRTKRKWVYWEESAKEPWKENLRCWCLCHYIKM